MAEDLYPEHTKLKAIQHQSQTVGEFLEWLDSKGIQLCTYLRPDDNWPTRLATNNRDLLAEYFDIDQKVLEDEKRKMLDEQRKLNANKV